MTWIFFWGTLFFQENYHTKKIIEIFHQILPGPGHCPSCRPGDLPKGMAWIFLFWGTLFFQENYHTKKIIEIFHQILPGPGHCPSCRPGDLPKGMACIFFFFFLRDFIFSRKLSYKKNHRNFPPNSPWPWLLPIMPARRSS